VSYVVRRTILVALILFIIMLVLYVVQVIKVNVVILGGFKVILLDVVRLERVVELLIVDGAVVREDIIVVVTVIMIIIDFVVLRKSIVIVVGEMSIGRIKRIVWRHYIV